jgi:uncharacterized cofD-like protein
MFLAEGHVHPAALEYTDLCANFEDGTLATYEQEVDEFICGGKRLERIRLAQSVQANEDAVRAIASADVIVISPGSWYTSIIPTMLPEGMADVIRENRQAPIVWIVNLLTEGDEMATWSGTAYMRELMRYTSRAPTALLVNSNVHELPDSYSQERKYPVNPTLFNKYSQLVRHYPLWLDTETPRHDIDQLAMALGMLLPTVLA